MPKGTSKSTAIIQRLLEERRQYEAWIARLNDSADATPGQVRARVRSDYEARLAAVTEELKAHADSARQAIEEKRYLRGELQKKETTAAEKLTEAELRHAVGEYDEAQWEQVHREILAEVVSVREDLQAVEADLRKLQELDALVHSKPSVSSISTPAAPPPPAPGRRSHPRPADVTHDDELEFLKSVTEDHAPSPQRASGAQFQPVIPADMPRAAPPGTPRAANPAPAPILPETTADEDEAASRTLRCKDCGTMNLPTEWYCSQCGAELAAV